MFSIYADSFIISIYEQHHRLLLKGDYAMRIENLQNENRTYAKSIGNFHVLEYMQDASVSPINAMNEYFMSKMNVRRRQVVIDIDKDHSAIIQAGAMQWMGGNVRATSGVKGIGDFLGKAIKGALQKKPQLNRNMLVKAAWY